MKDRHWELVQAAGFLLVTLFALLAVRVGIATETINDDLVVTGNAQIQEPWEGTHNAVDTTYFGGLRRIPNPSTDLTCSGEMVQMTVDSGATASDFAYILHLDTDGELVAAQANAVTTMPAFGFALDDGVGSRMVFKKGYCRDDAWTWTVGGVIYVSDTAAGGLTQTIPATAGDYVQVVGYALSADVAELNFYNYDMILVK
jgi:hypothetical protein